MPREYHRAYEARYLSNPVNRARRAEQMRSYAKADATRQHHWARQQVRNAIRRGDLLPSACEVCGEITVHAHHDDYSKPLDVRWLCPAHHHEHHAKAEGRS